MLKEITTPIMPVLIEDLGMLYPTETSKKKIRYGLYKCSCGNEFKAQQNSIKSENTNSCGCYKRARLSESHIIHGLRHHHIYSVWIDIKQRTINKNKKAFKYYGERGISICNEWRNDFKAFYDWSIANGYMEGLEIDRRNNDGNYEPSNCRWITRTVQARNTRLIISTNKSGYRGVSWNKNSSKWTAKISISNKSKHLGSFNTAIYAAKAYDDYVIENDLEHTINGV